MKSLKIFFLLLAMLVVDNSYGQTKEETIAWIKDKLSNSTKFIEVDGDAAARINFAIKKIDECSIVITYKYGSNSSSGGINDYEQTLPIKDVNINEKGRLTYSSEVVVDKNISKGKYSFIKASEFEIVETEPDLRNRVLKALKHLATFCEKKKETF